MEELLKMAGILTAIILCFIGIVKLPFTNFKAKKPKLYKATFTLLSIILSVGACIITQLYILSDKILTTNFIILVTSTLAGVFGLYSSYEGLGLKTLVKELLSKMQELANKAPESKLSKYIDKLGIDKALEIIEEKKNKQVESAETVEPAQNQTPTSEA